MYAVVKTGGKQYRVAPGDVLAIEKIPAEAGETITFDDVLLVGDDESTTVGQPLVVDCVVTGEVIEQTKAKKIIVFKMKRRKNYRRKQGHRQQMTRVRILDVAFGAGTPPVAAEA